jgi:hypothetical protein
MFGGFQQHVLETQPVRGLHLCAVGNRQARGTKSFREVIAHALQLAEIEQSRVAPRLGGTVMESSHRVGGDECVGELPLESGNLRAERAPRGELALLSLRLTDGASDLALVALPVQELH